MRIGGPLSFKAGTCLARNPGAYFRLMSRG
ncbi:UNVERIFIED_ORG: hypothetical protein J2W85_000361 [Ensifer adhaerens]|jgi:hypothetical protein|nr:hypothetical protein [Ensifer adhaerens]